MADRVFITLNSEDQKLKAAGALLKVPRLGSRLEQGETSASARYVDLSGTGVGHRCYISRTKKGGDDGQRGNPCIIEFYREALNGTPVDLDNYMGVERIEASGAFLMKKETGTECQ